MRGLLLVKLFLVAPGFWPGWMRLADRQALGQRSDALGKRGSGRRPHMHIYAVMLQRIGASEF
ncbi:hypothetical protein A7J71_22890 [Achromobacter insolitus]|nr:hypothetical protein A7J71_22890 [Achromobacter insolitus]OCZ51682.1 hypothetical protein A7P22_13955 [Achromobacter insolitus]